MTVTVFLLTVVAAALGALLAQFIASFLPKATFAVQNEVRVDPKTRVPLLIASIEMEGEVPVEIVSVSLEVKRSPDMPLDPFMDLPATLTPSTPQLDRMIPLVHLAHTPYGRKVRAQARDSQGRKATGKWVRVPEEPQAPDASAPPREAEVRARQAE